MNRVVRSRLSGIAVLLITPLVLIGCMNCDICSTFCYEVCPDVGCMLICGFTLCGHCAGAPQGCTENADECAATSEYYQAAIQFCEEYPEDCARILDALVGSLDTDAEE
jgi:hypothetical protein